MSKKLVKEIQRALKEDIDVDAIRALASQEGARAAFEQAGALTHAINKSSMDAFGLILETGVDVTIPDDWPPLVLVASSRLSGADRALALRKILERGADIDAVNCIRKNALQAAVSTRDGAESVRALLEHGPSPVSIANAISEAVEKSVGGAEHVLESLTILLEACDDLTTPDRKGFSPIHAAAVHGNVDALERLIATGVDVNLPLRAAARISAKHCEPPGERGVVVPSLNFPEGLSAYDVAERTLEMYRLKHKEYGDRSNPWNLDGRSSRIARLETILEKLEAAGARRGPGARRGQADRSNAPPYRAELDALLTQLGEAAGADLSTLARLRDGINTEGYGPWGYLSTVIERTSVLLLEGPVADRASEHWLGRLLIQGGKNFDRPRLNARDFPNEAQAVVKQDLLVAVHDDAYLMLWKQADASARVCEVRHDGFEVLGLDVIDFARRQVALLCGLAEPEARASSHRHTSRSSPNTRPSSRSSIQQTERTSLTATRRAY